MDPSTWLLIIRTVRFGETDAAGVMHFHQLLRWCHEAYEESLERFGLKLSEVFPRPSWSQDDAPPAVALPIMHCSADYLRPLRVGDSLTISLNPARRGPGLFEVGYHFTCDGKLVARGLTRHQAIMAVGRRRCSLPVSIEQWLESSSLACDVTSL